MPRLRFLIPVLVLLVGQASAPAAPRERDVWHAFIADGQRYGSLHTVVKKQADGNFRYTIETRVLIDLLGVQKQEFAERAEYVVTPTYRPVSVQSEGKQISGVARSNSRLTDGKLVVTLVRAGLERTREIDLSTNPILRMCLDDWLNDQPDGVRTVTANVINEESWTIEPGTMTALRHDSSGSVWRIDLGAEGGRGMVSYDADGVLRELNFDVPKVRMQRCTPEEARDISHLRMDGRDVLMFPIDRNITVPENLTALTVKLTWKDIPFEQFELEDYRQHLVEKAEKNGNYHAIVRIDPDGPGLPKTAISYPVSGDEFAPYLAETRFIRPRNERIAAAARKAIGDKKTAVQAVEALSRWVFEYIEGALIGETLSGPEVLECKKGKCSEYSTLFASLARSVGIPTRIVLGDRMVGGNWIGHMWNEAYVGEWIPVDASADEVGGSFALLKFIHSDSVYGTQSLRWALTESLDVSIEDFKQRASPLADKFKAGIEGRVYTNVDFACRLTAPHESWSIEDKSKPGVVTIRFAVPDEDDVLIHFVAFAIPGQEGPEMLINARLNFFESKYKDFEVQSNEPYKVHGSEGIKLRFRRTSSEDDTKKMRTTEVVWKRASFGYLLNIIAEESAHDRFTPDYDKLLASFEYLSAK